VIDNLNVEPDCADELGGSAYVDECNVCDDDPSNDCVQDCAGTWGGSSENDECGICGGDNSSCEDCAGTPNGDYVVDNCGTCDSDSSNDCLQDCAGTWGGAAAYTNYYLDLDGDGLGAGSANEYCSAFVPSGWVANNTDLQPNCATNDTDECGICAGDNSTCLDCANVANGNNVVDNCGTCDSDSSNDCVKDCAGTWGGTAAYTNYYIDSDGDGLGAGSANEYCSAFVPSGWVANNTDLEPDCFSNDKMDVVFVVVITAPVQIVLARLMAQQ